MEKSPKLKQPNKDFLRLIRLFEKEEKSDLPSYMIELEANSIPLEFWHRVCPGAGDNLTDLSVTEVEYELLTKHGQLFRAWLNLQQ